MTDPREGARSLPTLTDDGFCSDSMGCQSSEAGSGVSNVQRVQQYDTMMVNTLPMMQASQYNDCLERQAAVGAAGLPPGCFAQFPQRFGTLSSNLGSDILGMAMLDLASSLGSATAPHMDIGAVKPQSGGVDSDIIQDSFVDSGPSGSKTTQQAPVAPRVPGEATMMSPDSLRFSQTTAGGNGRANARRASMSVEGWNGPPVDAVASPDGIVTLDNTRVAVARELGMAEIPVNVHQPSDLLPESMIEISRFGDARTWGEALTYRTGRQKPPLPPTGTPNPPRMPK